MSTAGLSLSVYDTDRCNFLGTIDLARRLLVGDVRSLEGAYRIDTA